MENTHPLSDEKLKGNEWSWIDTDLEGNFRGYHYTTNYGGVLVSKRGKLLECIYGIGREYGNVRLEVQIEGSKFRVSRALYCSPIQDELINSKDMSRSNGARTLSDLPVKTVLTVLLNDSDIEYYCDRLVRKTLYQLIVKYCKLDKECKVLCKEILKKWRVPIIHRTSIITKEDKHVI